MVTNAPNTISKPQTFFKRNRLPFTKMDKMPNLPPRPNIGSNTALSSATTNTTSPYPSFTKGKGDSKDIYDNGAFEKESTIDSSQPARPFADPPSTTFSYHGEEKNPGDFSLNDENQSLVVRQVPVDMQPPVEEVAGVHSPIFKAIAELQSMKLKDQKRLEDIPRIIQNLQNEAKRLEGNIAKREKAIEAYEAKLNNPEIALLSDPEKEITKIENWDALKAKAKRTGENILGGTAVVAGALVEGVGRALGG